MTTNNAQVSAIRHKDVKGRELLYLKIEVAGKEPELINIGQRTYDAVEKLTAPRETSTTVQVLKEEVKK